MVAQKLQRSTYWELLTEWQLGNTGTAEVRHYQNLVLPFVMDMLAPQIGERVLELNFNQGALVEDVLARHASYIGIESEQGLVKTARKQHGHEALFLQGDICNMQLMPEIEPGSFQAVVSLLSMQEVESLEQAFASVSWALGVGGRFVMLLVHPYYHLPFQSGMEWDPIRQMYYRRVDRYMTSVRMPHPERLGYTYHRPLTVYTKALKLCGLYVADMEEVAITTGGINTELHVAEREFPMFMIITAEKHYPSYY
jgi:SAM-dependent methyltransferase